MSEENPEINNIINEQEDIDVSSSEITVEDDPASEAVEDPVEDEPEDEPEEAEDPVEDDSGELTEDLKQRIAELDYLRELSFWLSGTYCLNDNITFQKKWTSKNVSIDTTVNYEDILEQLEKIPEIVKLWSENKERLNYFKKITLFTPTQSLLDSKNRIEKIEILEKIFEEIINYAFGRTDKKSISEFIDNL